jgi:hypothetical protein
LEAGQVFGILSLHNLGLDFFNTFFIKTYTGIATAHFSSETFTFMDVSLTSTYGVVNCISSNTFWIAA